MPDDGVARGGLSELAVPLPDELFRYRAVARPDGRGTLTAEGDAPTSRYTFFFCPIIMGFPWPVVSPARFELRMIRPTGAVDAVRTPFRVTQLLIAVKVGATLTVTDASGDHAVIIAAE